MEESAPLPIFIYYCDVLIRACEQFKQNQDNQNRYMPKCTSTLELQKTITQLYNLDERMQSIHQTIIAAEP